MNARLAYQLADESWTASVERLVSLWWGLSGVLRAGVPGAVVELGCHAGHASVWLARCLADVPDAAPRRELVLFDSFEGLPQASPEDVTPVTPAASLSPPPGSPPTVDGDPRGPRTGGEPGSVDLADLPEGALTASRSVVLDRFDRHGLPRPRIVAGWFDQTMAQLPERIAFAYLDADRYASTRTALHAVWPRLSTGGLLMLDDYADPDRDPRAWAGLPGVRRAGDEFFSPLGLTVQVVPGIAGYRAVGYLYKPSEDTSR